MIPRVIYTFWFSEDGVIPPHIQKCIDSQKALEAKGYKHILVTDPFHFGGRKDAYIYQCLDNPHKNKRWVKMTDYLRFVALWEGGITLDADVEILPGKDFDHLLDNNMVIGEEGTHTIPNTRILGTAVLMAEECHPLVKKYLEEVKTKFTGFDSLCYESSMDILNIKSFDYGDFITIVPPEVFYPYNHVTNETNETEKSITYHHFGKTWVGEVSVAEEPKPGSVWDGSDLADRDFPKVHIYIPHIEGTRELQLQRLRESINNMFYPGKRYTVEIDESWGTVPQKVSRKFHYSVTPPEYFCFLGDDTEVYPAAIYNAVKYAKKNSKALVAFNSGPVSPDLGNICEHFILDTRFLDMLDNKDIFHTDFNHVGCDNYLWAQMDKFGLAAKCETAEILHHHYSNGAEFDDVYKRGWDPESVKKDRETLRIKLEKLNKEL